MLTSEELYGRLLTTFGPSEGWPGNTAEIMATAVMVQNTAWTAVVRAMERFGVPETDAVYADYHWLLLEHGKRYCKKRPLCDACPLSEACAKNVREES